jgi:hypothetical protein
MHAVELDPTRLLKNKGAIRATLLRIRPAGAVANDVVIEAESPQDAQAVRLNGDTRTDLGQRRSLLIHLDVEAMLVQGVGRTSTADAAANDRHPERARLAAHRRTARAERTWWPAQIVYGSSVLMLARIEGRTTFR